MLDKWTNFIDRAIFSDNDCYKNYSKSNYSTRPLNNQLSETDMQIKGQTKFSTCSKRLQLINPKHG